MESLKEALRKQKEAKKEADRATAEKNVEVSSSSQKLQEMDKRLALSESVTAELKQLINSANAPIFGIDHRGLINKWNKASERITGFKNIIGRSNLSILLPSGRRLHSESISHVFKSSVNVDRFQLWIFSDRIEVKYVAQIDLGEQELTLTRMARIVDSEFAENMHFKRVTLTDLKQTQSGKFPLIIDNS